MLGLYNFVVSIPVSDNRRLRPGEGRWVASDDYASALDLIRGETLGAGFRPQKGVEYKVVALVYFKDARRDLSSVLKGLLDGVFGTALDKQVVDIRLVKRIDGAKPRVELEIQRILE